MSSGTLEVNMSHQLNAEGIFGVFENHL